MAKYRRNQNGQRTTGDAVGGDNHSGSTEPGTDTGTAEIGDSDSAGAGTGTEEGIFTDPATVTGADTGAESETGTVRRKRGRPKGSGGKTKAAKVSTSLEGIEGILLSLHMMGAAMLQIPELVLSEKEAASLTDGIARVASLYDFGASEKTIAWMNLAVIAGGIYGTRAFAYHLRIKQEVEEQKQKQKPNVISFG